MAKSGFLHQRSSLSGTVWVKSSSEGPTKAEDCRVCFVDVAKGPSMLESRRGFSAFNVAEAVQRRREVR